jgi:hypothetical protein
MIWLQEQKINHEYIGAALRGFGKALGKKTGKSTSKFVKRRITVGGTPLNTKERQFRYLSFCR